MIGLFVLGAASLAACPVDRARYVLRHDPDVTASFRAVDSGPEWPSGLALAIHYRKSGKTFWWLPWNGGSDGLQNIASTGDVTASDWHPPSPDGGPRPYGNRQYLGTDAAYNLIDHVPRTGEPAPAHMLFPDSAGSQDRAFAARQFFDIVGCAAKRG
jgi:hypothetical protein